MDWLRMGLQLRGCDPLPACLPLPPPSQIVLGATRPALDSPRRKTWLMCHRVVGVLCFVLAFAAIPLGVQVMGPRGGGREGGRR